jgi:hypothetical protein
LSIRYENRAFENPGQTGDKTFTLYNLEILELEDRMPNTFVLTESKFNKGSPIGDNLIAHTVRTMVDWSKELVKLEVIKPEQALQAHQATVFAGMRNGNFYKCAFREYYPTKDPEAVIDFTNSGGAKIEVSREIVLQKIAEIENWKFQQKDQIFENLQSPEIGKILRGNGND